MYSYSYRIIAHVLVFLKFIRMNENELNLTTINHSEVKREYR